MGFASYLKHSVWDFLLCACASSALCYVCLIAFQATSPLQAQPWTVVVACVALTLVLFMVAYRFVTAVAGSIALVVVFCVAVVAGWQMSGAESLFADGAGNYAYAVVLLTICPVVVFLLSRKKATCVALLAGGLIMCAIMEYLYWQGQIVAIVLFGVCAAALFAYRNYQQGLAGSLTEKISFGSATIAALVIAALGAGLACGVFALVIAPLDPPNLIIKLVTTHVRVDEEHLKGSGDSLSVQNPDLFSLNTNGEQQVSMDENGVLQQQENMDDTQQNNDLQTIAIAGSAFNIDNTENEESQAISLTVPDWLPLVLAVCLVLLIALVIALRKFLRARWLGRVKGMAAADQVKTMFLYFLASFGKMKVPAPVNQTLREHAASIEAMTVNFEQVTASPDYTALAGVYASVVYGSHEPSDEELSSLYDYYARFHKRAVKYVGRLKYVPLFFRI